MALLPTASRRQFLGALAGAALAGAAPARRPNIVFLLADDLGWRDFGCYGNTFHETPNIDRLASEGVRFTNAYAACPVCSPTRASIMTGKYPARLHLTTFIPGRKQTPADRLRTPPIEMQLPPAETTLAEALKELGYRTGSFGKWHLGGRGFLPENQGFDISVPGRQPIHSRRNAELVAAAESFIEESAGNPFFLYFPSNAPHIPLEARADDIEKYRRKNGGKAVPHPVYAAMVEDFDSILGRLRRKLDQMKIADNTIVIVNSDNGGLRYEDTSTELVTDNSPLRAGKGHVYEGGIREPLIVRWPGATKAGAVLDTPVSSQDYLPTLVEVAGGRPPRGVDGVSIAPLLRGGRPPKRDALYWHYPHYSNQGSVPTGAIRRGDWKLIEFFEDGRLELYNLKDDIGERRNLARRQPSICSDLHAQLRRWRESVGAAMPVPNPDYDPSKAGPPLTGAEPPTPDAA